MKLFKHYLLFLVLVLSTQALAWKIVDDHKDYRFSVPDFMEPMTGLNDEASHQMGSVRVKDDEVEELYVIIIQDTKREMKETFPDEKYNAMSYFDLCLGFIKDGLDEYNLLQPEVAIEKHNKMDLVRTGLYGRLGDLGVIYQYAVYQGKGGFYQVLTWTLESQYQRFRQDMERIILSFEEK